jgi:hypothetical protein
MNNQRKRRGEKFFALKTNEQENESDIKIIG